MSDADVLEKPETDTARNEDDTLFCAACDAPVTRERFAVERRGTHEHTVFNPLGRVFVIRCFDRADGVRQVGDATAEFTWFPKHTWRLGLCAACGVHLGWSYEGPSGIFHGVIKRAVRRSRR